MPSFINNTGFGRAPPNDPPGAISILNHFCPLALYYQDLLQLPG